MNFTLLGNYFTTNRDLRWVQPEEGETSLHGRLLGKKIPVETLMRFQQCFDAKAQKWLEEPAQRARELIKMGRMQAAMGLYREALTRQPSNWLLLCEVAMFLTYTLQNPGAGLRLAQAAVQLNPGCSADVWNTLGDCLFELKRFPEASQAFARALGINGDDVRARFNLAFIHTLDRDYRNALVRIAEALELDRHGVFRQRLLQKQQEILALMVEHQQRRLLGQVDRVAGSGSLGTSVVEENKPGRTHSREREG